VFEEEFEDEFEEDFEEEFEEESWAYFGGSFTGSNPSLVNALPL